MKILKDMHPEQKISMVQEV